MQSTPAGWEGSVGPGPGQYRRPHVYARDIQSGAGNCVCGSALPAWVHIQAAPGVDIPPTMRHGSPPHPVAEFEHPAGWCYLCTRLVDDVYAHVMQYHPPFKPAAVPW